MEMMETTKTLPTTATETILNFDQYALSLLKDIANAKHTIELETYIYANDPFGVNIATALVKAAKRGVKIKLLVDGAGTPTYMPCFKQMEEAGVEIKVFHPLPWKWWQLQRANYRSPFFFKITYLFSKLNSRNHRKTVLIDDNIVYVGSANITQRHFSVAQGGEGWSDTIIRLTNVNIQGLKAAFNIAWKGFSIEKRLLYTFKEVAVDPLFRLNYSRHHRRKLYKFLLNKISKAKNRIWLTSAYFNPDYMLLKKLIKAAKRGVSVRIILPHQSDIAIMPLIAKTFYSILLKSGACIYEYQPGILHSKILIVDNWFCIGSSNLNHRSLIHDLEVDVNIRSDQSKTVIENIFLDNASQSQEVDIHYVNNQPFYKKALGILLLYGKYFL